MQIYVSEHRSPSLHLISSSINGVMLALMRNKRNENLTRVSPSTYDDLNVCLQITHKKRFEISILQNETKRVMKNNRVKCSMWPVNVS